MIFGMETNWKRTGFGGPSWRWLGEGEWWMGEQITNQRVVVRLAHAAVDPARSLPPNHPMSWIYKTEKRRPVFLAACGKNRGSKRHPLLTIWLCIHARAAWANIGRISELSRPGDMGRDLLHERN